MRSKLILKFYFDYFFTKKKCTPRRNFSLHLSPDIPFTSGYELKWFPKESKMFLRSRYVALKNYSFTKQTPFQNYLHIWVNHKSVFSLSFTQLYAKGVYRYKKEQRLIV